MGGVGEFGGGWRVSSNTLGFVTEKDSVKAPLCGMCVHFVPLPEKGGDDLNSGVAEMAHISLV